MSELKNIESCSLIQPVVKGSYRISAINAESGTRPSGSRKVEIEFQNIQDDRILYSCVVLIPSKNIRNIGALVTRRYSDEDVRNIMKNNKIKA